MKNINELKIKLNILKEKLQLELNIKYPNISEVEPLISFEEIQSVLKYRNNFTEIMKNIYKYEYPTSIQSISIPLINENKKVEKEEGEKLAEDNGALFCETSAKEDPKGFQKFVNDLVVRCISKRKNVPKEGNINLNRNKVKKKKIVVKFYGLNYLTSLELNK